MPSTRIQSLVAGSGRGDPTAGQPAWIDSGGAFLVSWSHPKTSSTLEVNPSRRSNAGPAEHAHDWRDGISKRGSDFDAPLLRRARVADFGENGGRPAPVCTGVPAAGCRHPRCPGPGTDPGGDPERGRRAPPGANPRPLRLGAALPDVAQHPGRPHRRARSPADKLSWCIGCGCLSLERCGLFNPDDRAASAGPGAHYLFGSAPKPDPAATPA